MNMTRINYVVCTHEWESICSVVFNRNCFPKMKVRLRPLKAVTYTVYVVVSKK